MEMTFRWYGRNNDTITLEDIKQIPNTTGIVWALHEKPVGAVWEKEEIKDEVEYIESHGFNAKVVESVNVHESIKLGNSERDELIENYKQTIENLAEYGVEVICYNFMPIFDWTRTDMFHPLEDGSTALYFDYEKVKNLDPKELIETVSSASKNLTMPGWEPEKLDQISELFEAYKDIDEEKLWENFAYFINAIIPTAERCGIKMAIHPDDPPYSIFNLPRIITGADSYERMFEINNSPNNAITLCTGSLGASKDNDMAEIALKYHEHAPFMHIRNVHIYENGSFVETSHFTEDGNIDIAQIMKHLSDADYKGYIRPDHGRHLWNEECRPGYGLYDRALGIMYLNGLWDAYQLEKESGKNV
ncbi:mannonate dehydratase [Mammaliicoccus sciuri]|uniref:mannonate dehydratase n=1 Tax=Mammaliicoccus sciuri TaxID=1296 RepID=UPI001953A17B|nr:mannonate dehydratase [Mammaliicoccus sciuri]